MSRWPPDAQGRLERAALDLFSERGYQQTTVAQIAERAGLNERSFYRHFSEKRDVLSSGQAAMEAAYVQAISRTPAGAPPMEAIRAGLLAAAALVDGRGEVAHRRYAVIAAEPELQERELLKRSRLARSIDAALQQRGLPAFAARLAAEQAVGTFSAAYARWGQATDPDRPALAAVVEEALQIWRDLATAEAPATTPPAS